MTTEEKKTKFLHTLYELQSRSRTSEEYRTAGNKLLAMYEQALNDADTKAKEAAWEAWKHRGGLSADMVTSERFEAWFNDFKTTSK